MAAEVVACLPRLDPVQAHLFKVPAKLINEGADLSRFLVSTGYRDILTFLGQLNRSMFPAKTAPETTLADLDQKQNYVSASVLGLRALLKELDQLIELAPPDPGPRRFGNISFRKWFELVQTQSRSLLETHLPPAVVSFPHVDDTDSIDELKTYLLGSFGSAQRLDYGTGHELSFVAFLGGMWKLGGFFEAEKIEVEREIVLGVVQPYLALVRKLILTYSLEPAGTHGVWGLDDHSFVPYIFGSAQYGPAISEQDLTPTESSLPGSPDPGDVVKMDRVAALRDGNMYFGAIGFIHDVKKGPFWEHSPTLYDISGVKAGWGKINKGMMKMYNAEVLSKFPVVQHFPFGTLFSWDLSPEVKPSAPDVHAQSQPTKVNGPPKTDADNFNGPIDVTTTMQGAQAGLTRAPWATGTSQRGPPSRMSGSTLGTQPPAARLPSSFPKRP